MFKDPARSSAVCRTFGNLAKNKTTTIVMALANGAKAVVPAASSEEAVRMTSNLQRDGFLLAGERKSLKIPGFALGNSPREMTPEVVAGKTVFLATTNGTPALVACVENSAWLLASVQLISVTTPAWW